MPVHELQHTVDVLQEFPCEPALADPALARDRDQPRPTFTRGRVEEITQQPEFLVAPHKWSLEAFGAPLPAALGNDAESPPSGHRRRLAPQDVVAGLLVGDRAAGGPLCRLAHQHAVGGRDRLEPARGVDEVARDHALVHSTERDGRFAGQYRRARFEAAAVGTRVQRPHRLDQVECGPDGALGVVLLCDRRPPDRHDRVADELLDGAAVALDDLARPVEVAREQVAHGFGVAVRGERGEADQVREQHRYEPPLGRGCRRLRRAAQSRGRADAARGRPRGRPTGASRTRCRTSRPARSWRHSSGTQADRRVPHSLQNFAPGTFSVAQVGQITQRRVRVAAAGVISRRP